MTDVLSPDMRQELEQARLGDVGRVHIDDMLEYAHEGLATTAQSG